MKKNPKLHYYFIIIFSILSALILVSNFIFDYSQSYVSDPLLLLIIFIIIECIGFRKLHMVTYSKMYYYINFALIVALLMDVEMLMLYLTIVTLMKFYFKKELQNKNEVLKNIIIFLTTFTVGSLVGIIGKEYIVFENLFALENIIPYILLVLAFNIINSIPFTLVSHFDNRLSFKDSQNVYFMENQGAFITYVLYFSIFYVVYFNAGIIGATVYLIILYKTDKHFQANHIAILMSLTDQLTSAFNRRHIAQTIEAYTKENRVFSIIMLDIDDFKRINETYSHIVGDYVLKEFVKIIKDSLRDNDLVCRYGGEEFTVILENVTIEDTIMIAERIRENIERHTYKTFHNNEEIEIKHTSSLGVSIYNKSNKKYSSNPIEVADNNLKFAKHSGKNKVHFHETEILEDTLVKYKEKKAKQKNTKKK